MSNNSKFLLLLTLIVAGCKPSPPDLSDAQIDTAIKAAKPQIVYQDDITVPNKTQDATAYEATQWITTNRNFAPFGSNHFRTREDAVKYVRRLYGMGAPSVYVVYVMDEPDRIKSEGGPYSDGLFVYLPTDPVRRRAIFAFEAREAKAQGFAGYDDNGQDHLFFWMHE